MSGLAETRAQPMLALVGDVADRGGVLVDAVRDVLEEAILDGRLQPGMRLNASALAADLGLSHIPVREALRALGADGWVDFRPNAGAFVCKQSEHAIIDIFEARILLEAEAARLAADRRSPAQIDALTALVERQRAATAPNEVSQLNADFHSLVAECSQNEMLARFVSTLAKRARFYFARVVPVRLEASVRDHEALVDALARRDAVAAAQIAREHVEATCRSLLDSLDQSR